MRKNNKTCKVGAAVAAAAAVARKTFARANNRRLIKLKQYVVAYMRRHTNTHTLFAHGNLIH